MSLVGAIVIFSGSGTLPAGWLECNGASLATADYPELFAVTGYTFGGAGASFTLPDARGRHLIGAGTGPGLTARAVNDKNTPEGLIVSVFPTCLPAHNHTLQAMSGGATTRTPFNNYVAATSSGPDYVSSAASNVAMQPTATSGTSTFLPLSMPTATMRYMIRAV